MIRLILAITSLLFFTASSGAQNTSTETLPVLPAGLLLKISNARSGLPGGSSENTVEIVETVYWKGTAVLPKGAHLPSNAQFKTVPCLAKGTLLEMRPGCSYVVKNPEILTEGGCSGSAFAVLTSPLTLSAQGISITAPTFANELH